MRRSTKILIVIIVVVVVVASVLVLFAFPVVDTNSPYLFATKWGSSGTGDGQFNRPLTLAIDAPSNTIYVADRSNHRVQKFDSNGNFITKWGSLGTGDGQFDQPSGVAIDASSNVYSVELNNHRVQKFQLANPCPTGTTQIVSGVCFVTKWGSLGTGDGQFDQPSGVAIDASSNTVYVTDYSNHRVQKFQLANPCPTGTTQIVPGVCFVTKWGSLGTGDGQFDQPSGVAIDASSNTVYVTDQYNHRVQKFQLANPCPTGTTQIVPGVCFVTKWGSSGTGDGQFNQPADVTVDSSSNTVYVADTYNNRIQKFDSNGNFITKWGSLGTGDGQFGFSAGIAIDSSSNTVYVVDHDNHRVQKFIPPHRTIFDILVSRIR